MKLVEYESRNGGGKLIQVLPFSIENYEKLKSSDNIVFLVEDDKEIKEYFFYNLHYFHELEWAYESNTLFYEILYNYEKYTEEEIEYLIKFIDFDKVSTYIYYHSDEEYFYIDEVMENKYLKDKVNYKIILKLGSFDLDDYFDDENELDIKNAFKCWKEHFIKEYGLTLSDEDWKECFMKFFGEKYWSIDEDELE